MVDFDTYVLESVNRNLFLENDKVIDNAVNHIIKKVVYTTKNGERKIDKDWVNTLYYMTLILTKYNDTITNIKKAVEMANVTRSSKVMEATTKTSAKTTKTTKKSASNKTSSKTVKEKDTKEQTNDAFSKGENTAKVFTGFLHGVVNYPLAELDATMKQAITALDTAGKFADAIVNLAKKVHVPEAIEKIRELYNKTYKERTEKEDFTNLFTVDTYIYRISSARNKLSISRKIIYGILKDDKLIPKYKKKLEKIYNDYLIQENKMIDKVINGVALTYKL